MERLVAGGCRLVCFEGNHDFHLGPVFSERLKAEIHTGPVIKCVQGKRLYICHGDQINREDHFYRCLRFLLHTPVVTASVGHFPPSWAQKIREILQKRSRAGYLAKTAHWNYHQILLNFADTIQKQGCDGLVSGHFHLALREKLPGSGFTLLSLGDWMEQFTYGEMQNGDLQLKIYSSATA